MVPSLEGLFIEDIAVGCEHVLVLSSTGDVYAWGCNSEGQVNQHLGTTPRLSCMYHTRNWVAVFFLFYVFQLGLGHSNPVKEPTLVTALQAKNIRQISAGRCHSSAWTTPSTSIKNPGTHTYCYSSCRHTRMIHKKGFWDFIYHHRLQVALETSSSAFPSQSLPSTTL